ncbi:MAG: winged helix-turn-helix domain-containing protein [Phycisphaeraceae bacterium]|nr:winged helix-turn-helix domain-containing protein [Phycisphaeraceae bacterium]
MQATLSVEEEKRLVILMAVAVLGGSATKSCVLDLIDARGWLSLDESDREIMETRNEARWRNDLAFIRHHLVLNGCLSGLHRNQWEITPKGRQVLRRLATAAKGASPHKLNRAFIKQIECLASEHFSDDSGTGNLC